MSHHRQRYTINHEAMQGVSLLGVIDPETGAVSYWQPDVAVNTLVAHISNPGFDRERYCGRCQGYDDEMGLNPGEKWLGKHRRSITTYDRNPVALPWQPGKPAAAVHLHPRDKSRPGHPMELDSCHMCLFSFLDPVEPEPVSDEEKAEWQALARRCRDDYERIKRACANPGNPEAHQAHFEAQFEQAKRRLGAVIRLCRERGFEPWRWGARREGDEAPAETRALVWIWNGDGA